LSPSLALKRNNVVSWQSWTPVAVRELRRGNYTIASVSPLTPSVMKVENQDLLVNKIDAVSGARIQTHVAVTVLDGMDMGKALQIERLYGCVRLPSGEGCCSTASGSVLVVRVATTLEPLYQG
jgi:hypothetical protein